MDFMYGLDNNRYAEFKAEIVNDLQKGTISGQIVDLNKMYILASRRVVVKTSKDLPGGATFATVDDQYSSKNKPNNGNEGKGVRPKKKRKQHGWQRESVLTVVAPDT